MKKTAMQPNLAVVTNQSETDENRHDTIYISRRNIRIVDALFNCIDLKDPKLARHCQAVAAYSLHIASAMGLGHDLRKLREAALLHDIGKLMVDTAILNKQGSLTDREFLQVRGHSERGMRFLSFFRLGDIATDVAWHHHERWDGQGYPDGLKENEIHQFTRIVTVADAVDAMAENRPYRNHLSDDEIISQLSAGIGRQFEPDIAETAIRLIQSGELVATLPEQSVTLDERRKSC